MEWIKFSDTRPDPYNEYLVLINGVVRSLYYGTRDECFYSWRKLVEWAEPTHWMPLPKRPKE